MDGQYITNQLQKIRKITESDSAGFTRGGASDYAQKHSTSSRKNDNYKRSRSRSYTPNAEDLRKEREQKKKDKKRNIEIDFQRYLEKPQSHPEYRQQWEQFWNVRSIQLQGVGVNPDKYDLSDEWKAYFEKFLKVWMQKKLDSAEKTLNRTYDYLEKDKHASKTPKRVRRSKSKSPIRGARRRYSPDSRSSSSYDRSRHRRSSSSDYHSRSRNRNRRSPSTSSRYSRAKSRNRNSPRNSRPHQPIKREQRAASKAPNRNVNNNKKYHHQPASSKATFIKNATVAAVCDYLMNVSELRELYESSIKDIKAAARDFEKTSKKEYCMSLNEYYTLDGIREDIHKLLSSKHFPFYKVAKVKDVRAKLEVLLRRWQVFTQNGKTLMKDEVKIKEEKVELQSYDGCISSSTSFDDIRCDKSNDTAKKSLSPSTETIVQNGISEENTNKSELNNETLKTPKKTDNASTNLPHASDKKTTPPLPIIEEKPLLPIIEDKPPLLNKQQKQLTPKRSVRTSTRFSSGKIPSAPSSSHTIPSTSSSKHTSSTNNVLSENKDKTGPVTYMDITNENIYGLMEMYHSLGNKEQMLMRQLMEEIKKYDPERYKFLSKEFMKRTVQMVEFFK